jgi:hypothetical protein
MLVFNFTVLLSYRAICVLLVEKFSCSVPTHDTLPSYQGIRSQVNFATFFVLNAKMLESMTFQCQRYHVTDRFLAEQHQLLQLEKKASRWARFYFTTKICEHNFMHINHAHDLSKTDPFECGETRVDVCASFE